MHKINVTPETTLQLIVLGTLLVMPFLPGFDGTNPAHPCSVELRCTQADAPGSDEIRQDLNMDLKKESATSSCLFLEFNIRKTLIFGTLHLALLQVVPCILSVCNCAHSRWTSSTGGNKKRL